MDLVRKAEQLVESTMAGRDGSHDVSHAFRVRDMALSLASEEGLADPSSPHFSSDSLFVVEIAALLHDIGDYKYSKDGKEDTSILENFLHQEGLSSLTKDKIVDIIKKIGFKDEVSKLTTDTSSLEFDVVQDADRLDAIGAIGIARCFMFGGSKGAILHDPKISPRINLSKEEYMSTNGKSTTINHFHEKLVKLKDMMKTKSGQRRSVKRHRVLESFLSEFYEEWDGKA
ncbi:HD domain containing protein, expressed [Zostera marina]|uniref:HD domain containing protein, expressed n=1 Tax=Zostera marina TaxID=29655 RepID=A0A0K9PNS0_ZOSMR|nr:HD domain containing protein, expressed [Zostera marina]